ncbi:MAG: malonic semialdehyde reductase [Sphingobium sp.]|uniref:Putative NADH dehydrogenase/NAD(P)H nitroreductase CJD35_15715 n=1 Tax=Sphingobium xenophagum TaxID=121428 RepID=A0A249MX78_SPHXE|nr:MULTISPECIES: malonic semialdehyde reductase [Sphingobium]ASY45981.1 nitroreductase family protein [Sphingobium xenophagum]OUC53200.1 nitroreductase family protein [Sphingobium sp. GW456-12-10-14-TSB1]TAJ75597.1 MAG: malonic semialdehyde reductase [Sphingobium sp.]|tara:strand:+ start:1058 stop:1657 length:600 start_codon:yes stop_codon:yes gene_type:complete
MPDTTDIARDAMLDLLFRDARTHNQWTARPVTDETVRRLYNLAKWGPTTANSNPGRFVFVRSAAAKERLKPHLSAGNVDKVMQAPCTVIVAGDTRFYEFYDKLFPSRDMRSTFEGKAALIADTVARSSTLQGAYLIMAARALGLDCGPMSGFDQVGTDAEFFPDGRWKSNFLCNIGYGNPDGLFPRNPRLDFEEACLDL